MAPLVKWQTQPAICSELKCYLKSWVERQCVISMYWQDPLIDRFLGTEPLGLYFGQTALRVLSSPGVVAVGVRFDP